jgi:hypothetical protein
MDLIEKFCKGENVVELSKEIAKILFKNFKSAVETVQELESEVVLVLLERKEKLCREPERLSFSYLVLSVRNALVDKFFRSKKISSLLFSEISEENGSPLKIKAEGFSPLSLLNVREAFEKLKKELSEKEMEILCYYFHSVLYRKEEKPFLKNKSQDAKYKAWSRLRPKVKELLKNYDLTEKEIGLLGELLLSEFSRNERL